MTLMANEEIKCSQTVKKISKHYTGIDCFEKVLSYMLTLNHFKGAATITTSIIEPEDQ